MRRIFATLLVFLFSWWLAPSVGAANASLYLSPSSEVYSVGNTFSVAVRVNTGGIAINAAEAGLIFSPDKLSVVSLSKSGSIFSLWTTEPSFSNSDGTVSFGGGVPNPGFSGASGKILTITFRAKTSGTATVGFSSGAVLANDGKGTNILSSLGNSNYTLQVETVTPSALPPVLPPAPLPTPTGVPYPPEVSSSSHSDSNKWYSHNSPEFKWDLSDDVTGVSIMLTDKLDSNPGPNSDGLFDSKTYENLEDGIHYLHLKLRNRFGWSQIAHFRVQIDTKPPKHFKITVSEGTETYNPRPTLFFETTDQVSGLDHYRVKIGEGDFFLISLEDVKSNPYQISLQAPGKRTVAVKAVDQAGNETLAMTTINILPIESPIITDYPQALLPGDVLDFNGTAIPGSVVLAYVQQRGEESIVQTAKSNKDGAWSYVYDQPVEKGIYKIWARAINSQGAQSLLSEKITIKISQPILVRIGNLIVERLTIIISILTFLALLIFGLLYTWLRFKLFVKRIKKETKEAEQALHRAFDALRENAEQEIKLLTKVKTKRGLTKEEERIRKNLKKNLNIAEKYIEKEIKDIEHKTSVKGWFKKYINFKGRG